MADPPFPPSFRKELSQVNSNLYTAVTQWLKKHGKAIRPKLTDEQKEQLQECFELMDQDGSGAIDADELGAAFKLLGIRMKKAEIEELLNEVDHDGSGEVEYPEFLEIMTSTLQRLAEEEDQAKNEGQVPFGLMATAYRRKRLMEGIIQGDKEVQAQIQQLSDKASLDMLQHAKQAASGSRTGSRGHDAEDLRDSDGALTPQKSTLRRFGALQLDPAVLKLLGPEERKLLGQVAAKQQRSVRGQPSNAAQVAQTARQYQHYTQSPTHRKLLEMPETFPVKFSRSTIKLPMGALIRSSSGSALETMTHRSPRGASPPRAETSARQEGSLVGGALTTQRGTAPARSMSKPSLAAMSQGRMSLPTISGTVAAQHRT